MRWPRLLHVALCPQSITSSRRISPPNPASRLLGLSRRCFIHHWCRLVIPSWPEPSRCDEELPRTALVRFGTLVMSCRVHGHVGFCYPAVADDMIPRPGARSCASGLPPLARARSPGADRVVVAPEATIDKFLRGPTRAQDASERPQLVERKDDVRSCQGTLASDSGSRLTIPSFAMTGTLSPLASPVTSCLQPRWSPAATFDAVSVRPSSRCRARARVPKRILCLLQPLLKHLLARF